MIFKSLVATSVLLVSVNATAYDFGVGVKGGTTGAGVDLSMTLTDTINVRFSTTRYDFGSSSENINIDDGQNQAQFDSELAMDFGATGLLLDWYVFDGTFHVTAGIMKNNTTMNFSGDLNGTVTFNGEQYDAQNDFVDSTISGDVSLGDSFEPYFGIGWGRKASSDSGFSLSVELGVMLLSPSVDLTAPTIDASYVDPNNPGNTQAQNQANLDANVQDAEDEVKADIADLEMWPVFSVGLNYAF